MKPLHGAMLLAFAFSTPAFGSQATETSGQTGQARARGEALLGHYHITEGAKDGEKIPAERLEDNSVVITKDTIAVVDRDKKELYSASYKVSRSGERGIWNIDMTSQVPKEGSKAVGLLKRDGKEVWLIYSITEERPKNFEKTEKGQHLFKMTREAKAASLNEPPEKDE